MEADLNFDLQQIKITVRKLRKTDVQLAYVALITRGGLKASSRWEKLFDDHGLELLQGIGLLTRRIRRTVKSGREVIATILGASLGCIQLNESRFGSTPVNKSAAQNAHRCSRTDGG